MKGLFVLLWVFECCFTIQTDIFNLARYTITQNALTISKNKHNNFTQEILDWLNSQPLPHRWTKSWQHNCAYLQAWVTSYHFTIDPIKDLNYQIGPDALNTQITAHLVVNGNWKLRDEIYVNYLFGHFCLEYWWCNSNWNAAATIIANVSASVGYDVSKGPHITPTIKVVDWSYSYHIGEEWCLIVGGIMAGLVALIEYFVKLVLQQTWDVLWILFVEQMTPALQAVHEIALYEGVKLTYWYVGLIAVTSSHIQAQINGTLSAQSLNGKWTNFTVDSTQANMIIPNTLPLTNGPITNKGEEQYFLNDLRVTSSILQGIIWAADERGELTPSFNFTVLDSAFLFRLIWGYPMIAVPTNNTIEFRMGYGLANGTCFQNTTSTSTVVLQFNFSDLLAYGTVALDGSLDNSNLTLAFQFNSIDTSHLKPFLIIPQIPLPANVVQNMMLLLINNSIALINSWSASHAIQIPNSFLPWISSPVLNVVHQDGCCNGTHGYLDFASTCTCSSAHSQLPLCPSTASCTKTETNSSNKPPNNINHITHTRGSTYRNGSNGSYGVWWYVYASHNDDASCNVAQIDDDLIMVKFPNTNGICTKTPIDALSQYATPKYYLLNMTDEYNVNEIRTVCNKTDCTDCMYNNTNVHTGHCYGMGNVNTMFQIWTSSSNVCIGGNKRPKKSDIVLTAFNDTKTCNENILVTMKNMGPILDECLTPNNSNGTGTYAILETLNSQNNSYMFKDQCNAQCKNCSIQQKIYMNRCQSYDIKGIPASYIFSFGNDTEICGDEIHNKVKIRWDFILSILFGSLGVFITIIIHVCHFRKTKENHEDPYWVKCFMCCINCHRVDSYDCKTCLQSVVNSLKEIVVDCGFAVYNSFIAPTTTVSEMEPREKYHASLFLFSCVLSLITYYMWHTESPWDLFDESSFEFIGVPADSLDITDLTSTLNYWEMCCELYFIVFAAIFLISLVARFICIRKPFGCSWSLYQMVILLLYIHLTFLLTLISIPTFYSFTNSIKLNSNDNNAFTGSADIQGDVNTLLGYSFTGVFLSFFSNVILYFVYSVPIGIYIASLIFIRQLFVNSDLYIETDEYSFVNFNRWMTGKSDIFYYDMSQEQKVAMVARVVVMLFVMQSMCLCIECLPVIIMYQSFGTSYVWISCWMVKWIMPIILLYFAWVQCQIYSRNCNSLAITEKCQINITINGIITFVLFCAVSVVSIWCEANHTKIAVWFTISSCITGFISGAICWIFVLHYMFEAVAEKNSNRFAEINGDLEFSLTARSDTYNYRHLQQSFESKPYVDTINFQADSDDKCGCGCERTCCCGIWYFLFEYKEFENVKQYGARASFRRFCLLLGCVSYGYISTKSFIKTMQQTTKEMVINFVNTMNWDIQWPDNDEGGTLFDKLFHTIDTWRKLASALSMVALVAFVFSFLFDVCMQSKKGLRISKQIGWFAILFLFGAMFTPVMPDYLAVTPIDEICPQCGPEFNRAVHLLLGDCIGLFCAAIFIYQMSPIVIGIVTPAIVRSGFVVLHTKNESYKLSKIDKETVNYIMIIGAILTPYVTFIPLLCYQQFDGDYIVGCIMFVFWIFPLFLCFKIQKSNWYYWLYLGSYYILLIAIFVYHCIRFGLPEYLKRLLLQPDTIIDFVVETIAEISLTIVILSDFIYSIVLGLKRK